MARHECTGCDTLAKVLFWAGAVPTLLLGILRVGDNLSMLRDEEHLSAGWIIPAVGVLIGAMIGPKMDPAYTEASYLWCAHRASKILE